MCPNQAITSKKPISINSAEENSVIVNGINWICLLQVYQQPCFHNTTFWMANSFVSDRCLSQCNLILQHHIQIYLWQLQNKIWFYCSLKPIHWARGKNRSTIMAKVRSYKTTHYELAYSPLYMFLFRREKSVLVTEIFKETYPHVMK